MGKLLKLRVHQTLGSILIAALVLTGQETSLWAGRVFVPAEGGNRALARGAAPVFVSQVIQQAMPIGVSDITGNLSEKSLPALNLQAHNHVDVMARPALASATFLDPKVLVFLERSRKTGGIHSESLFSQRVSVRVEDALRYNQVVSSLSEALKPFQMADIQHMSLETLDDIARSIWEGQQASSEIEPVTRFLTSNAGISSLEKPNKSGQMMTSSSFPKADISLRFPSKKRVAGLSAQSPRDFFAMAYSAAFLLFSTYRIATTSGRQQHYHEIALAIKQGVHAPFTFFQLFDLGGLNDFLTIPSLLAFLTFTLLLERAIAGKNNEPNESAGNAYTTALILAGVPTVLFLLFASFTNGHFDLMNVFSYGAGGLLAFFSSLWIWFPQTPLRRVRDDWRK